MGGRWDPFNLVVKQQNNIGIKIWSSGCGQSEIFPDQEANEGRREGARTTPQPSAGRKIRRIGDRDDALLMDWNNDRIVAKRQEEQDRAGRNRDGKLSGRGAGEMRGCDGKLASMCAMGGEVLAEWAEGGETCARNSGGGGEERTEMGKRKRMSVRTKMRGGKHKWLDS